MLKFYIFLYFYINLVYATDRVCVGKHILPMNDENYTILKRHIGFIHTLGFGNHPTAVTLENNGQTVIIKYVYKIIPTIMDGPYRDDEYQLEFMYFNWLQENQTAVDALPIELHMVFFNKKYETYEKAVKKNFGVTVWSFRYVQRSSSAEEIADDLYDSLFYIQKPYKLKLFHPATFLTALHTLIDFTPEYYSVYQGRLITTIQPCSADVIWLEFPNMLKINAKELYNFRNLLDLDNKPLMSKYHENIAPNGTIYRSIDSFDDDYEYLSVLGFEYFNASSNVGEEINLAVAHYENLCVFLILGFEILLRIL